MRVKNLSLKPYTGNAPQHLDRDGELDCTPHDTLSSPEPPSEATAGLPQTEAVKDLPFTPQERQALLEMIESQSCPDCGQWIGSLWSLCEHLKEEHGDYEI